MSDKVTVLDHGYVQFVEAWGSDERIIEAARMSTQKGFEGWGPKGHAEDCHGKGLCDCADLGKPGDEKLLSYLWKNNHATPFEMAGLVIEVQAPIFVFREWHRHRTQSYNEMSARYAPLPDLNYVPTAERMMAGGGHLTKQAGSTGAALTELEAGFSRCDIEQCCEMAEGRYQTMLKRGVPKEVARVVLPVGRYSRMRASANLRNWLGFLTLRQAPNAQWEIRQYADAVGTFIADRFPRTWTLFASKVAA